MKFSLCLFSLVACMATVVVESDVVYQVFYMEDEAAVDADAVIFKDQPDQAAGGANLLVGCDGADKCARSLLRFDISPMPIDAVIDSVTLVLVPRNKATTEFVMDVHQLQTNWTRTKLSVQDGDAVAGIAAIAGDVTWKYASYETTPWNTEGGDVDGANIMASVTSDLLGTSDPPTFFTGTDKFKEVVKGWIDGSVPNYGMLVKRDTEDGTVDGFQQFFHENSGNKQRRSPKLLITYTSESDPEQKDTLTSGPGILLPNEPTKAPTTSSPTIAPSCPADAAGTMVKILNSNYDATVIENQGDIAVDKLTWAVGLTKYGFHRGLLKFPLDGIPKGSKITCAEVILSSTGPCGPCKHEVDIEMFAVTQEWSSTGTNAWIEVTASGLLTEIELKGAGANTGDSTWIYSNYNAANPAAGVKWNTPGGDFDDSEMISAEKGSGGFPNKFPSSNTFVQAIQDMIDGTRPNYGFLLKTEESEEYRAKVAEENTYKAYDTAYRVFHGHDAEVVEKRPLLVIHYDKGMANAPTPTAVPAPTSDSAKTSASILTGMAAFAILL